MKFIRPTIAEQYELAREGKRRASPIMFAGLALMMPAFPELDGTTVGAPPETRREAQ